MDFYVKDGIILRTAELEEKTKKTKKKETVYEAKEEKVITETNKLSKTISIVMLI